MLERPSGAATEEQEGKPDRFDQVRTDVGRGARAAIDWIGATRPLLCVIGLIGVLTLIYFKGPDWVPLPLWTILTALLTSFTQDRSNQHTAEQTSEAARQTASHTIEAAKLPAPTDGDPA